MGAKSSGESIKMASLNDDAGKAQAHHYNVSRRARKNSSFT